MNGACDYMDARIESLKYKRRYNWVGFLYIAPWMIGFIIFQLYPFISSLYYSLTDLSLFKTPEFIGLKNFVTMFTLDQTFLQSLKVTFIYVLYAVPTKIVFSLIVALILNQKIRGINFYRTIYYLPSILGGSVTLAILWRTLFMNVGIVNKFLSYFHVGPVQWLGPGLALFTVSMITVWQFGSSMVLFLAGLKQIPGELYEAAKVDGASKLRMFFNVTLPQLTPIIFFNLIMQVTNAFQEFTSVFIVTNGTGGPLGTTNLFGLMVYRNGFEFFKMGYASAQSWVLFMIIMIFTAFIFKSSPLWIHYEDGGDF
jgi:oligogalacturonide transport system permease protein